MGKRVFVLGLDAFEPSLAFEKFAGDMPNLTRLREKSVWGRSRSTLPPLSCTAWVAFAKGKNPGQSGFHGFTSRDGFAYDRFFVANTTIIEKERIWDILKAQGKKSIVINVPVTYPPYDVNGIMVSCFLSPSDESEYCWPREIKKEINDIAKPYVIDVKEFKVKPKEIVFKELIDMEERRFKVAKEFIMKKQWDFFIMVTTGTDRVHHAFWADMDETHPDHKKDSRFKEAIRDYYKFIDREIGEIEKALGKEDAIVIMSDHGAGPMHGFFNLNDWLVREGYMRLLEKPEKPTRFEEAKIDWKNTRVFCTGNYVGRVFINLKGREPQGIVDQKDFDKLREEVREKILAIKSERGEKMGSTVLKKEEIYSGKHVGMQPDLVVMLDGLRWGVNQMIGYNSVFSHTAEKGRNASNHYMHGMFLIYNSGAKPGKSRDIDLIDLMPTILKIMGAKIPADVEGKPII